jgi:hypothetical protein
MCLNETCQAKMCLNETSWAKMYLNETYNKVNEDKYLSDTFPAQNGLKQGDALSPLLFSLRLEFAIRKVQESQEALQLNGTHKYPVNADYISLLVENVNTKTEKLCWTAESSNNSKETVYLHVSSSEFWTKT